MDEHGSPLSPNSWKKMRAGAWQMLEPKVPTVRAQTETELETEVEVKRVKHNEGDGDAGPQHSPWMPSVAQTARPIGDRPGWPARRRL